MLITQIEEWARNKVNTVFGKVAEKALEPAREVSSLLLSFRVALC